MNKKFKRILLVIIIFLVLLTAISLFYRFNVVVPRNKRDYYFIYHKISNKKTNNSDLGYLDNDKYKNYIIEDRKLEIKYTFIDNKESIIGRVYISDDNYLYMTDSNNNNEVRISNIKFKTLYSIQTDTYDGIYLYLISSNNDLYYLELKSNDITKVKIRKVNLNYKVTNFTNLAFDADMSPSSSTLLVLCDDGIVRDITSDLRYDSKIKLIYDRILVFEDKTMSNIYGISLEDDKKELYKIKYAFYLEDNTYTYPGVLIITENNDVILVDDNDYENVYEFYEKVNSINFDATDMFQKAKLTLNLENGIKIDLDAYCSRFFCPIES